MSKFPECDMKSNFFSWFKCEADTSASSSSSSLSQETHKELRALAYGPLGACSYSACIVNGVRFVVHSRDEKRTTQNSGVVSIGDDGSTWYGLLVDILELNYLHNYSVVVFRCKWFNTSGNRLTKKDNIITINTSREWYRDKAWYDDQLYILATHAKQVFYLQDPSRTTDNWKVVEYVHHRKLWDNPSMSVVNEIDVLHNTQSSDYNLVVQSDCEFDDETDDLQDIQLLNCNLVVDLGCLPMRTTDGETLDDDEIEDDDDTNDDTSSNDDDTNDDI